MATHIEPTHTVIHKLIKVMMVLDTFHGDCKSNALMLADYAEHFDRDIFGSLLEVMIHEELVVKEEKSLTLGALTFSITERHGNLLAGKTPVYNLSCSVKQGYWQKVRKTKEKMRAAKRAKEREALLTPAAPEPLPEALLTDIEREAREARALARELSNETCLSDAAFAPTVPDAPATSGDSAETTIDGKSDAKDAETKSLAEAVEKLIQESGGAKALLKTFYKDKK